jgi:competence protein ComEA
MVHPRRPRDSADHWISGYRIAGAGTSKGQQEDETMNAARRDSKMTMVNVCGALAAAATLAVLLVAPATAATGSAAPQPAAPADSAARVDVNTASAAELASLPGIGASKAAAIIAEREKKPFSSVDDLARVRGIGERTVEDLRGKVSVGVR